MGNPLLELMWRGESGEAGYNAFNRGTYVARDGKEHIRPSGHPIDFSQLTLGQVMDRQRLDRQDPDRVFAVGKYQVIPKTMLGAVHALGLRREQAFTPELQDAIFSDYLIATKRAAIHDYIAGANGVSLRKAQHALALEWASFGDPAKAGRSHYGHGNHASITLEQSGAALEQMRESYARNILVGMSAREAWDAVTKSDGHQVASTHREPDIRPAASVAGRVALDALRHEKHHPLINETGHPAHAMYGQIKTECDRLGGAKALGFDGEREYIQALANMTWQARTSGLTRVDHVVETVNKRNLVMIQGDLRDPAQQREVANKAQAASQSVELSTRQLQQDTEQFQQIAAHARHEDATRRQGAMAR